MDQTTTIAACQMPDIQGDVDAALSAVKHQLDQAIAQSIDLICFPECFLQGYTLDGQTARHRAIDLSTGRLQHLFQPLAGHQPTIILGLIEIRDGHLYNTAVVIKHGKLLGRYRKTHPNETIFSPGNAYPIFSTNNLIFGINICHDANYPEAAACLANQGAQAILYPLNNLLPNETAERWRHRHLANLRARARQTNAWVISSDVFGQNQNQLGYGCTAIIGPDGAVVAQVPELTPGLITAKISG